MCQRPGYKEENNMEDTQIRTAAQGEKASGSPETKQPETERSETELPETERLRRINKPLLAWYKACARSLPWRENAHPYRVWISEIMLQQTRIEAVIPYFERFMRELPDVEALAGVEDDRLMKLWEGLGYYNRAKNLKKAAGVIVSQYKGQMPSGFSDLIKLPGIGSYTAGAIASIAFNETVPAVDGNVLRVVSRILASREDILRPSTKKRMERILAEIMPEGAAGSFNQSLMELGERICVPGGQPKCRECPVQEICLARVHSLTEEIPVKTPPKKRRIEDRTVCILEYRGQIGLRRRDETGLLASLYELPNVEGRLTREQVFEIFHLDLHDVIRAEQLPEAKHIFSHVEWHMTGYWIELKKELGKEYIAAEKQELKTIYPLPNAFGRYTKLIK